MVFFSVALRAFTHGVDCFARRLKLLDDVDLSLVDAERHNSNKIRIFVYFIPLLHYVIAVLILNTGSVIQLVVIYCVMPLFLYVIPYVILRFGNVSFDANFHRFLGALKRQEMCLFSTNYFSKDTLLLRSTRIRYLEEMRRQIDIFQEATRNIAAKQTRRLEDTFLFNFINEELRELIAVDGPLDNDHLTMSSLRNCWQYLFLVRSEFLRSTIVASDFLSENGELFDISLLRVLGTTTLTMLRTFSFVLIFKERRAVARPAVDKHRPLYGPAAALTAHETVTYQLEWILQSLQSSGSIPHGDEAQNFLRTLRNIISIIETESGNTNADNSNNTQRISINKNVERGDLSENCAQVAGAPAAKDSEADLQIFEMYTGDEDNESLFPRLSNAAETAPAVVDTRPVLLELKNVISRRKEVVIEREIVALAKLRGVPVEQILRSELDRAIFAEPGTTVERAGDGDRSEPPREVSRGPLGRPLDAADLATVLAQRRRFADTAAIGESSSEGEIVTEDGLIELN